MNGYVIGGYLVVLISLATYAVLLVGRLRSSRRRLQNELPGLDEGPAVDNGGFR